MWLLDEILFASRSYGAGFVRSFICGFQPNTIRSLSVDVTYRCNLNCKHCYFLAQCHQSELSDEELLDRVRQIRHEHPYIHHASWVGGEPLLRKELVHECLKIFPYNIIVTNGLIPLPDWKNTLFGVSVDGTKEYYEKLRGNYYERVKAHADRNDIKVNIGFVINRMNMVCIESFVEEWSRTKVHGIGFDFYTPIRGNADELSLDLQTRDKIIERLKVLQKEYGHLIFGTNTYIQAMHSSNARKITSACPLPSTAYSIDPMGVRKRPCILGPKANCDDCGCIAPFLSSPPNHQLWQYFKDYRRAFIG